MTRVLVTGAAGQVGRALGEAFAGRAELHLHDRSTLDLADPEAIASRVAEAKPDVVVNAAAYTAVDRAETDLDTAHAINAVAPGLLAKACAEANSILIHFSTDYVFDGEKAGPWAEVDATAPLNAYGRTKLEGERAIAAAGCAHLILRTSWVYGPHGGNFLLTMLRAAETRDELRIVADQKGAPTSSLQLARLVVALLDHPRDALRKASGIYHATAAGETTWFGFAEAIFAQRTKRPRLVPIRTSDWPTPARRPRNSVLDNGKLERTFGTRPGDWREGLAEVMARLPAA